MRGQSDKTMIFSSKDRMRTVVLEIMVVGDAGGGAGLLCVMAAAAAVGGVGYSMRMKYLPIVQLEF